MIAFPPLIEVVAVRARTLTVVSVFVKQALPVVTPLLLVRVCFVVVFVAVVVVVVVVVVVLLLWFVGCLWLLLLCCFVLSHDWSCG